MDNKKYTLLLLKVAVCAIGSDNVIDDREIEMLHKIEKKSSYFSSINLEKMLHDEISKFKQNPDIYLTNTFSEINSSELLIPQELVFLEISILIIKADGVEEDVEKKFVQKLRSCLKVDDYSLGLRFREVEYLTGSIDNRFKDFDSNISTGEA